MSDAVPGGWLPMQAADLSVAEAIGNAVHVAHPEDDGRMGEKFDLFPAGCYVLRGWGAVIGYMIAYPALAGTALPLNAPLGRLPDLPDALYLHDLALVPAARATGAGRAAVEHAVALARTLGFATVSLVAVGGSGGFWKRVGFQPVTIPGLVAVLRTYDAEAQFMERRVQGDGRVASRADCSM